MYFPQFTEIFNFKKDYDKNKIKVNDEILTKLKKLILQKIDQNDYFSDNVNEYFINRVRYITKLEILIEDKNFYADLRYKVVKYLINTNAIDCEIFIVKDVIDFFDLYKEINNEKFYSVISSQISTVSNAYYFIDLIQKFDDWQSRASEDNSLKHHVISLMDGAINDVYDEEEVKTILDYYEEFQVAYGLSDEEIEELLSVARDFEFSEPDYDHEEYLMERDYSLSNETEIDKLFDSLVE